MQVRRDRRGRKAVAPLRPAALVLTDPAMALARDSRIVCPPEVLSRVLDGEAVLLHLGSGTYFGMNEVATFAWERITKGTTFGELLDATVAEFDVQEDVARGDLERLVTGMIEKKLVTVDA
jgi:hypothetical protein